MRQKLKIKLPLVLFTIIAFVCFYVFYTIAHPLYIYDTDDWTYISYSRHAWPKVSLWNPTKVLPETLMPFMAELGLRFIMPLTGDYIDSLSKSFAVVVALSIVIYLFYHGQVIKTKFSLNNMQIIELLIVLALLYFLPFNISEVNNQYLFYGGNVTCYFNYLIPALINACVVMYLMVRQKMEWKNPDRTIANGFLLLFLYLSINSNLLHSGILMAYIGMRLCIALFKEVKGRGKFRFVLLVRNYIKSNLFEITITIFWLASAAMEMMGGRAQWGEEQFLLKDTVYTFIESIRNINSLFKYVTLAVIIAALILSNLSSEADDKSYKDAIKELTICMGFEIVYLLVLCARVSPGYIAKSNVMISWMFYFLLMMVISCAYILKKYSICTIALPCLIYVLVFETIIDGRAYAENYAPYYYSPKVVKELDENIIRQVQEAEANGHDSVEVRVPVDDSEDWPIAVSYGGERISLTLYRHGIVDRKMEIRLAPDQLINNEFHLE